MLAGPADASRSGALLAVFDDVAVHPRETYAFKTSYALRCPSDKAAGAPIRSTSVAETIGGHVF